MIKMLKANRTFKAGIFFWIPFDNMRMVLITMPFAFLVHIVIAKRQFKLPKWAIPYIKRKIRRFKCSDVYMKHDWARINYFRMHTYKTIELPGDRVRIVINKKSSPPAIIPNASASEHLMVMMMCQYINPTYRREIVEEFNLRGGLWDLLGEDELFVVRC
jgi:hypothetical protein